MKVYSCCFKIHSLTVRLEAELTKDEDASLVDRDSVCAAAVLHGGPGLPEVPGYIVTLHGAQLAPPIIASYGVQVRIQTDQAYKHRQTGNRTCTAI